MPPEEFHTCRQVPDGLVEVARSKVDGDLDAAASRLSAERIPYFAVKGTCVRGVGGNRIDRILVPPDAVEGAKEIISLVQSGAFELRDGECPT